MPAPVRRRAAQKGDFDDDHDHDPATTPTHDDSGAVRGESGRVARMGNPMFVVDGAFGAAAAMGAAIAATGLPVRWADLINIRASQLNRCGVCLVQHQREARAHGMGEDEVFAIAGWQDAPWFTGPERAVLALTEAVTVLDPGQEAVNDTLWQQATAHLEDQQIAAVLLQIALVGVWNRVNRVTRQVAGQAW